MIFTALVATKEISPIAFSIDPGDLMEVVAIIIRTTITCPKNRDIFYCRSEALYILVFTLCVVCIIFLCDFLDVFFDK